MMSRRIEMRTKTNQIDYDTGLDFGIRLFVKSNLDDEPLI